MPISARTGVLPRTFLLFLLMLLPAASALGGDLCGHVRDAATGEPVAGAGVFVRDGAGGYLGRLAVTDSGGDFCITGLPGGFYTLEIRVDDYLAAYLNDVEVAEDVTSVPVDALLPPFMVGNPWPNPSSASVNFSLTILRRAPLSVRIYDARGRVVRSWGSSLPEPGPASYSWDGRDAKGRSVPSGLYFLRARGDGYVVTRRLALTR